MWRTCYPGSKHRLRDIHCLYLFDMIMRYIIGLLCSTCSKRFVDNSTDQQPFFQAASSALQPLSVCGRIFCIQQKHQTLAASKIWSDFSSHCRVCRVVTAPNEVVEDNIFSRVCSSVSLSVHRRGSPCDHYLWYIHWTSLLTVQPPFLPQPQPPPPNIRHGNLLPYPHPPASDIWWLPKHVWLASGRYTSYWNAFWFGWLVGWMLDCRHLQIFSNFQNFVGFQKFQNQKNACQ